MKDGRAWAALDLGYFDNAKVVDLMDDHSNAVSMHIASILHCAQHLTDGHVSPKLMMRKIGGDQGDVAALVESGMWHEAGHDCTDCPQPEQGRVYVHDFLKHNRSKSEAERKSNSARKAAKARWEGSEDGANKPNDAGRMQDACESHAERNAPTYLPTYKEGPAATPRRSPETRLPESWTPNEAHTKRAREKGLDLAREAEVFKLHAETHDRRAKNWNAAFTMWLSKAKPAPQSQSTQLDYDAWNNYQPDYEQEA